MSRIHSPQNFIELLGMQDCSWEEADKGAHGYLNRLSYGHISILYNGRDDMGVCLDMSGQGCRVFESLGTGDYQSLFFEVFSEPDDIHITRLDVAFDDHSGILDLPTLVSDTQQLDSCLPVQFICRSSHRGVEWSHNDGDERSAFSVYHGSRKSEIFIRIYDKAAERGFFDRHWVRVEQQLRRDRALAFAEQMYLGMPVGEVFRGVLFNYLRYVDDSGDSNRWRWPMKSYWADLLDGATRIRLYSKPGIEYNMINLEHYVFSQAGNAINTYLDIMGEMSFMEQLRLQRSRKLPAKYSQLIDFYEKWKGGTLGS